MYEHTNMLIYRYTNTAIYTSMLVCEYTTIPTGKLPGFKNIAVYTKTKNLMY